MKKKKLCKVASELPDGYYLVKDGMLYSANIKTFQEKIIQIPPAKIAPDDELQHVGYDAAQCGYEK
ncbi:MAG: hypothetical protein J6S49_08475 [Erysipelotrichaceae bacterium]|nr:hypothetical protein [Erysipelotrichaceae bacterium]